jgi:hypothetical protein
MRLAAATRNAAADAIVDRLDAGSGAGTLLVYTGSAPSSSDDAATGTLLLTFTLADPAFGAASAGVASGASLPRSAVAVAAGTAGWARLLDSDSTKIADLSVGSAGTDVVLSTTTITLGRTVNLTALTLTMPAGSV